MPSDEGFANEWRVKVSSSASVTLVVVASGISMGSAPLSFRAGSLFAEFPSSVWLVPAEGGRI